jgi:hypothetical protein
VPEAAPPRTDLSPAPKLPTLGTPAPAPAPILTPWQQLGDPFHKLAAPFYRRLAVEPPEVEAFTLFAVAWGGVVDHYYPGGTGPWPPAILATVILAAPFAHAKRPEKKPAAPDGSAPAAPPRKQYGKFCYELLQKGEDPHPTQICPAACECACHQALPA